MLFLDKVKKQRFKFIDSIKQNTWSQFRKMPLDSIYIFSQSGCLGNNHCPHLDLSEEQR